MDYKEPNSKRSKKGDKGKKTHDLHGGFSQKHIRAAEALAERVRTSGKSK